MNTIKTSFRMIVGIAVAALIFPANLNASREPVEAEVVGDFIPVTLDFNKVIADFNINDGNPPNNVGGNFGEAAPYTCAFTADAPDALNNPTGHSMRLPSVGGNACSFFSRLGPEPIETHPLDASSYKSVSFYMKSDGQNLPTLLGTQLKDNTNQKRTVWLSGVTNTWKKFSIPLLQYRKSIVDASFPYNTNLDVTRLGEFNVNFFGSQAAGNIYVDQIALSKQISNLTIADFSLLGNRNNLGGYISVWTNDACGVGFTEGHVYAPYRVTNIGDGCSLYMLFGPDPISEHSLNASDYKTISFDIRGDGKYNVPERLKIELWNAGDFISGINYISGVTNEWKTYSIPIAAFTNRINKENLGQFNVTVDSFLEDSLPQEGRVYVDNVVLKPQVTDLLLADFNLGHSPNNLYGNYGEFTGGGQCLISHVPDSAGDPQGHALRLDYGGMEAGDPYCGIWLNTGSFFNTIDLRDYRFLRMKVKGDSSLAFPSELRLDLYLENGAEGGVVHVPVTSSWEEVIVNLRDFFQVAQLSQVKQLAITVDSDNPAQGAVYIDDIKFTRNRDSDVLSQAVAE